MGALSLCDVCQSCHLIAEGSPDAYDNFWPDMRIQIPNHHLKTTAMRGVVVVLYLLCSITPVAITSYQKQPSSNATSILVVFLWTMSDTADVPVSFVDDPSEAPFSGQHDEKHQVGAIPELVHMITVMLRDDGDYQSLARMAIASRRFQADVKPWLEKRKTCYHTAQTGQMYAFTRGQLGVVRYVEDGAIVKSSQADLSYYRRSQRGGCLYTTQRGRILLQCLGPSKDIFLENLEEMNAVAMSAIGNMELAPQRTQTFPRLHQLKLTTDPGVRTLPKLHPSVYPNLKHTYPGLNRLCVHLDQSYTQFLDPPANDEETGSLWREATWLYDATPGGIIYMNHTTGCAETSWILQCGVSFFGGPNYGTKSRLDFGASNGVRHWAIGLAVSSSDVETDDVLCKHAVSSDRECNVTQRAEQMPLIQRGFARFLHHLEAKVENVHFMLESTIGRHESYARAVTAMQAAMRKLADIAYWIKLHSATGVRPDIDPITHRCSLLLQIKHKDSDGIEHVLYSLQETFDTYPSYTNSWSATIDRPAMLRLRPVEP